MRSRLILAMAIITLYSTWSLAAEGQRAPLWPEGAPGANGSEPNDIPTLTTYLPTAEKNTGCGIVVCPGGGYGHLATGQAIPAERIDHTVTHRSAPAEAATVEYGDYLLTVSPCSDCHGENLAGGQAGPGEPIGPNLTPGGELASWTQDDFITLMRTGVHPSGRSINPVMPWQTFRNMTDVELEAIWLALQARPALAYEGP